jgi:TatD DNase family protein
MFIDTHCHIHEAAYPDAVGALERARKTGVTTMVCVGTDNKTSLEAAKFASKHKLPFSVGAHPHDAKDGYDQIEKITKERPSNLVAIGEIGLDYFYSHSPRDIQIKTLEAQLQLAIDSKLPVIFHVREAFDDFWPIFRNFSKITGVLHSFTDSIENMQKGIAEGLYIGVNGISTFARDKQGMWNVLPLENMVLETDAPFLTPVPYRGKINEPAFVRNVAEYHATARKVELETLARVTSANASKLFSL